jgi:hypothetical protein
MTEQTPFRPCSKKGEIRAQIATMLLDEVKTGNPHGTRRALRRLLWASRLYRHSQRSGVRQNGQGRESELGCQ